MNLDLEESLLAARLCDVAYSIYFEPVERVEADACALGFDKAEIVKTGQVRAVIASDSQRCAVAFAGSQNVADWLEDFRAFPVGLEGDGDVRRVHRGFRSAVAFAADEIKRRMPHRKNTWVAGHSKGAAEATLFSHSLLDTVLIPDNVYAIASPRVGKRRFAREYDYRLGSRTWRFVNQNDSVTRLPTALFGWRHVGRCVYFNWRGKIIFEPGLMRRAFNQVVGRWTAYRAGNPIDGATDHLIQNYLPLFEKAAA